MQTIILLVAKWLKCNDSVKTTILANLLSRPTLQAGWNTTDPKKVCVDHIYLPLKLSVKELEPFGKQSIGPTFAFSVSQSQSRVIEQSIGELQNRCISTSRTY